MDQETAQNHLDNWLAADLACSSGQSYTVGNRQMTRADIKEIRNQITYWRRVVKGIETKAAGGTPGVMISSWNY